MNIAVLGATGVVGQEILRVLEQRDFPVTSLRPLASARSAGKTVTFRGKDITVEPAGPESFKGIDLVLASAGATVTKELGGRCAGRRDCGRPREEPLPDAKDRVGP